MEQLLQAFLKELELREDHYYAMSSKLPYKRDGNDDLVKGGPCEGIVHEPR